MNVIYNRPLSKEKPQRRPDEIRRVLANFPGNNSKVVYNKPLRKVVPQRCPTARVIS